MEFLCVAVAVAVLCAVIGAGFAANKGHDPLFGGFLGFLFGPIGLIIVGVMEPKPGSPAAEQRAGRTYQPPAPPPPAVPTITAKELLGVAVVGKPRAQLQQEIEATRVRLNELEGEAKRRDLAERMEKEKRETAARAEGDRLAALARAEAEASRLRRENEELKRAQIEMQAELKKKDREIQADQALFQGWRDQQRRRQQLQRKPATGPDPTKAFDADPATFDQRIRGTEGA
jgi:hypothetical protein